MSTGAVGQAMENLQAAAYTETGAAARTSKVSGRTVGNAQLSDEGKAYYEQLKKKYGNMEFILVDSSIKDQVNANVGAYANSSKMVVLIDTDKIERMAVDEEYRKQYEGIIGNAQSKMNQLKSSLEASGAKVKNYGIIMNDGGNASFFAVIDESLEKQRERIADKKEAKIKERKEAEKEAQRERWEKRRENVSGTDKSDQTEKWGQSDRSGQVTITANSMDELVKKLQDYSYERMSDSVWTSQERQVGWNVDFRG